MSTFLPKTVPPRQGKRKKDRWGPCRQCGYPGAFRCFRCKAWRCRDCVKLRKVPRGELGLYHCVCTPRCLGRMSDAAVKVSKKLERVVAEVSRAEMAELDEAEFLNGGR